MKQHITEKQWSEISAKQQALFFDSLDKEENRLLSIPPDIGLLIEFLDDGSLEFKDQDAKVIVWEWNKELCDELWERVKEKLSK